MEDKLELLSGIIEDQSFVGWIIDRGGKFRFVVYQGMEAMDADIAELNLSVRPYNCLKRAGYQTINEVVSAVERREDLLKVRNMGKKSADEVMLKIFLYNYEHLRPEKRRAYIEKVKGMNQEKDGVSDDC